MAIQLDVNMIESILFDHVEAFVFPRTDNRLCIVWRWGFMNKSHTVKDKRQTMKGPNTTATWNLA